MKMRSAPGSLLVMGTLAAAAAAQSPTDPVVGRVGDDVIRRSELELAAASQIVDLLFERQKVLQQQLDRLLADRVLKREAAALGLQVSELVQAEVHAKTPDPTAEEIDAFYEQNKNRIPPGMTRQQVDPEIRTLLSEQARRRRYTAYIDQLRSKYGVSSSLEPLRLEVVADGHPARGPATAPVTIVEFSDFECPYCAELNKTMDRVLAEYGDRVRLVFRQFPLTSLHPRAMKAAEASLCAAESGRFWELHDSMFSDQKLAESDLRSKAESVGLDPDSFAACLSSGKHNGRVKRDLADGQKVGVTGTPALFVNGRPLKGAVTFEQLKEVIDDELGRGR